jgi:nucleoid-associated protein YgaU
LRIEDNDLLIRVEREQQPTRPSAATAAGDNGTAPVQTVAPVQSGDSRPGDEAGSQGQAVTMMALVPDAVESAAARDIVRPGEFIRHRVVRGDTLWHIAKHYLGDPFRYPQLARLSRIDNPDLIYPGDLVTIERRRSLD